MEKFGRDDVDRNFNASKEADKKNARNLRRLTAAIILGITAIVGVSYANNSSKNPDSVELTSEQLKDSPNLAQSGEVVDNEYLEVGSTKRLVEGVFVIDHGELNVRKDPKNLDDASLGKTNKYNLSKDLTVVNPIFIDKDVNGSWFLASDAKGRNYFFTGNNGGITDYESGEAIGLSEASGEDVQITATTTMGNLGKDRQGNDIVVATIADIADRQS